MGGGLWRKNRNIVSAPIQSGMEHEREARVPLCLRQGSAARFSCPGKDDDIAVMYIAVIFARRRVSRG